MRRFLDTTPWLAALCLVALTALPAGAAKTPDEIPDGGTANAAPPAARISYLDGTLYCWGPFDDEKRQLILNDIVREGDELYAAPGTWAEVEFPGSTFLRLDGGSSVVVQHYRDDLVLIPTAGAFYVSTGDWSRAATRFGPDNVEVTTASVVRLDISPDEFRRVGVAHGLARLEGDDLSLELVQHDQAWAEQYGQRWSLGDFIPRDGDDFDMWSLEREGLLRQPLDEDTPSYPLVGYSELVDQGTWVVADGVWVWRPYVEAGWRPFTRGEWIWVEGYGWTWVSGHTWGYVTSHHGRWVHDPFYGWVWMPGMTWAPAWVTWSVHGHYVGWCPIDWWGYPVVLSVGWYSYWDYRCWTFSHHDYFYHGGYHHAGAYHYHHHHHSHHNSHHRHSSPHDSHQASSSHRRQGGDAGASASHDRDSDGSNSRSRSFGSDFRTFDKGEFESARPVAVRDANKDLLRRNTLGPEDRQSFERGGDSRDALLTQRFTGTRKDAYDSRPDRGAVDRSGAAAGSRGTDGGKRSSAAQGIGGEGATGRPSVSGGSDERLRSATGTTRTDAGERASRAATESLRSGSEGTGGRPSYNPTERTGSYGSDTRTTTYPTDRSSSSSTGTHETYTPTDRSSTTRPYVPQYQGRSDGQKSYSGSSRSSTSSGTRSSTSSGSTTTRPRSSTSTSRSSSSSSSTRSRSSSSSSSKSKSSSGGSKKSSSSSSRSKSSGSKKKK